jgi:hypothetical protein
MTRYLYNPDHYFWWWDDFDMTPTLTTASGAINRYPYMSFIDSSDTIVKLATEKMLGVLRLTMAATDNNAPFITAAGDYNSLMISDTAGDDMPLWYEHRWRKSSVANDRTAMFGGLCEEARATAGTQGLLTTNAGVLADIDHIGFNVAQDAGAELNFAYTKSGQTDTELIAAVDTLVADTWYKNGFKYQPASTGKPTSQRVSVHINGSEQSTYVTATQIAAATFPDGEELMFAFGIKEGTGTGGTADLDWVGYAQEKRSS